MYQSGHDFEPDFTSKALSDIIKLHSDLDAFGLARGVDVKESKVSDVEAARKLSLSLKLLAAVGDSTLFDELQESHSLAS